MIKTLLLMRHAKSSWKDESLADHDRPLNKRGRRAAPKMGQLLRQHDLAPDLVLTSTAERATATAQLVAEAVGYQGRVHRLEDLYHAGAAALLAAIGRIDDRFARPLVVGHNPALADLLEKLSGEYAPFPTAAVAWLELEIDHWRDIDRAPTARLRELWRPREIEGPP